MTTISDVAKRAGVSPVTVSRVINNVGNVSPATQRRVEVAIQELGYVPSGVAQSLRRKRTRSLALIVPDIENSFWTTVARGVEDAAQDRGYSVFLCNTDENPAKQLRYLDVVVAQRVDGVIIAPYDSDAANLAKLRDRNIPTVVVDRQVQDWGGDTVSGDSISGARALVKHLVHLGHQRIAVLAGPANTSTAADRVTGYRIALAEAGIPENPQLICFGEFRAISGERMMAQVLDVGAAPTAVFAANNAIAMGVIDELERRNLRVPHDIALVSFDDLPNTSRLFPFLTVVVQPAYEIGANAAQLLLSRLEAESSLQPRQVVLPTRLIVRYSCGSKLKRIDDTSLSLPLEIKRSACRDSSVLVPRIGPQLVQLAVPAPLGVGRFGSHGTPNLADNGKSDIHRLMKVLRHQEADRVPHLELWITGQSIYEHVLERRLDYTITDPRRGRHSMAPEDHVEFAQRLGMDAVICNFSWRPNNVFGRASDGTEHYVGGTVQSWSDLERLEPPPILSQQLDHLEGYLRAAQGTGVGVAASFTSFFDSALLAIGVTDALYLFYDDRPFVERLMDILWDHQQRVMRAVCDRFAQELAFIVVEDDVAHNSGLLIHPDMFAEVYPQRMRGLIAPAREYGKLLVYHSDGKIDGVLPILHDIGFAAVHPVAPECNDIYALRQRWAGDIAFIGNIPSMLLAYGSREQIEERVRRCCADLAAGGGYVLGSSASMMEGIPPVNFTTMVQATHRFGYYENLGEYDSRYAQ